MLAVLSLALPSIAQPGFSRADTVPVKISGNYIDNPWAGGLNFCQFSTIDLNFDGIKDLFVFDRSGSRISTYINNGTPSNIDYTYAAKYRDDFPAGMVHWVLLYDYDGDGLEDIFTYAGVAAAAKVYRNISTASTGLQFTLVKNVLNANYAPQTFNLYISSVDIPALADIDNDSDMDILNFEIGGSCVNYFKNMSMENYGHNDSLVFEIKNRKWGWFSESGSSNQLTLNDYSNLCQNTGITNPEKISDPSNDPAQASSLHASSTLLALDMNADGVKDLLIGDGSEPTMTMVYNDGGTSSSHIDSAEYSFPSLDVPVNLQLFPAAFYVDVDNDSVRDLLVSPNAPNVSENFNSVLLYKNNGADDAPVFNFVKNNFLQDEMIEVGEGAYPVFFDYDADGLQDLLVSNHAYFTTGPDLPEISVYKNIGTASAPSFELITRDYEGLSSFGFFTMKPTFGDLDADGDDDMIIGDFNGRVHYFENTAGPGNPAAFVLSQPNLTSITSNSVIDVGQTAAPQIADLDRDGIPDLIIGARSGKLAYYRGTNVNTPLFDSITHFLGSVNVAKGNSLTGYNVPFLYDHNGSYRLLIGSESGHLYQYTNIDNNLNGNFFLADSTYMDIWEGMRTAPALAYLNNDTLLDLVVGNYAGGVALFLGETTTGMNDAEGNISSFDLYPNPASELINVVLKADINEPIMLSVYSLLGQELQQKLIHPNAPNSIEIDNLPAGMYYCTIHTGNSVLTKKFIVQR